MNLDFIGQKNINCPACNKLINSSLDLFFLKCIYSFKCDCEYKIYISYDKYNDNIGSMKRFQFEINDYVVDINYINNTTEIIFFFEKTTSNFKLLKIDATFVPDFSDINKLKNKIDTIICFN